MFVNFFRKLSKGKPPIWLLRLLARLWGPYFGAGVVIDHISKDFRNVRVRLKKRWYNTNYVGTQFGGSIYAMVDPMYMLMLMNNLGNDYIVWDKSATIRYKKPGKTELHAECIITEQEIQDIIKTVKEQKKMDWQKDILVKDKNDEVVTEIQKVIYIAEKAHYKKSA